jgi:hypothetical protein
MSIKSPYYFASILDEHARMHPHVEIIKQDGERILLVGKVPQQRLELAPVQDEPKRGHKWMEPAPLRPMPESEWTLIDFFCVVGLLALCAALVAGWIQ